MHFFCFFVFAQWWKKCFCVHVHACGGRWRVGGGAEEGEGCTCVRMIHCQEVSCDCRFLYFGYKLIAPQYCGILLFYSDKSSFIWCFKRMPVCAWTWNGVALVWIVKPYPCTDWEVWKSCLHRLCAELSSSELCCYDVRCLDLLQTSVAVWDRGACYCVHDTRYIIWGG